MDRCRCEDYARAVAKLRFYTVGTHRPDIIDNFDRTGFRIKWATKVPDYTDMKFEYPKASKVYPADQLPLAQLSDEARRIERMWCPFMTPVVKGDKDYQLPSQKV